jgi:hypothetical protein
MMPGITGICGMVTAPGTSGGDEGTFDPFLSSVVLLLGFEGADAATATSDESPAANGAGTFAANAQLDTAQKKFGSSSLLLDGNGDWISWADNADWEFGSGDFTIEAFVRFSASSGFRTIVSHSDSFTSGWIFDYASGTDLRFACGGSAGDFFFQRTWSPTLSTWYHVCVERSGNTFRQYVDGSKLGSSGTYSGSIDNAPQELRVGSLNNGGGFGGNYFDGWVDELRITKGVARYASDSGFTVPSAAYPRA